MKNNKVKYLSGILSTLVLAGCNSGTNTGGGQHVTAAPLAAESNMLNLFTQSSALQGKLVVPSSSSIWYLSGATITITNTSSTALDLSKSAISFASQDIKGNLIIVGTFTNWYVSGHGTSYSIVFTAGNGTAQVGQVKTGNSTAATINPGETITFTAGFDLKGNPYDVNTANDTFSLDGASPEPKPTPTPTPIPTPSETCTGIVAWDISKVYTGGQKIQYNGNEYTAKWWTQGDKPSLSSDSNPWKFEQKCSDTPPDPIVNLGALDVVVDTTNTDCKNSNICHGLTVHVADATGQEVVAPIVVPDNALGGVFTQPITGLKAGSIYSVASNALANTTLEYNPATAKTTIIKDSTVTINAKYTKLSPAIATGKIEISLPTVVPNYTGELAVEVVNVANSNAVVGTYLVKQGASFTTENLPISDSKNQYIIKLSKGLADPKNGLYYVESGTPQVLVNKDTTTSLILPLIKSNKPLNKVIVNLSGLEGADRAKVSFDDVTHTFAYVNQENVQNGNLTYLVESSLNFGLSLVANGSNAYEQSQLDFTGIINKDVTYTASFKKKDTPPLTYNYDYFDPKTPPAKGFQDYNYNVNLTLNGDAKPKTITLTSNFQPTSLAGGTCFGQGIWGDGIKISTKVDGNLYKTTLTTTGSFDLKDRCLISGGDTGNSKTIISVPVPYISSVTADGLNVPIFQPCSSTGCKDPGNGYVNAGYYANWAVWGRSYNPNKMPFDKINDIIYAFIGFNPSTGTLKSLDISPDYWGLVATTKAMLQYPYMHAHLSFGGWTNAGVNTAPMFQQLSSSPAAMQTFATQAVELMRQTKFTGIDIDWEWWSDYSNNQAPAKQMLAFYKILRTELDKASIKDGKHYTLTIAVNAGVDRVKAMQNTAVNPNAVADFWKQVNGLVDQVNLMTYDYHGAYDQDAAYFHANYDFANVPVDKQAAVGQTNGWSIKDVVAAYQTNGIETKKLVVGLPIYARTMQVASNVNGGLLQPITSAGFGDWEAGVLDYKCLINPIKDPVTGCGNKAVPSDVIFYSSNSTGSVLDTFNKYGRDALQPWGYSPSTNTFITFDDAWSVKAKTQKVIDQKLGGTMFWELDGDSTDTSKSLVKAVSDKYLGK